ncbi:MAG: acyl carrier protein [Bacteroidetes bacterium]|nr:acyl carrier protein [Bacteroidota bacterium]
MITVEEFTKNLEAEFEEIKTGTLTPTMHYRQIPGWSSMYALIIIAFVDTHFEVQLNATDLKNAQTIQDLYTIVLSKQQA